MYRLHWRAALGLEFNPGVGELGPLASVFLRRESACLPALTLGTSSDRIGSPEGTASAYLTATKQSPWRRLSGYASLNWSEWDQQINFPFGASVQLLDALALRPMYDGERTHLLLSFARDRYSVSALWLWLEDFGISFSLGLGGEE
jgi:hypothetical protein